MQPSEEFIADHNAAQFAELRDDYQATGYRLARRGIDIDRLKERGIATGKYNLPDWGDSPKEFRSVLDSLFQYTPPTALIVDQPSLLVAVFQHLSRLQLTAPEDVSLACTDQSESFEWFDPQVTHISWDARPVINRVVKWADHLSRGKDIRRKNTSQVNLVLGGTVGPVARS